jgi:tetratricopeptide (TPR) repeat protein
MTAHPPMRRAQKEITDPAEIRAVIDRAQVLNAQGEVLASEMVQRGYVAGAPELHANACSNLANNHTTQGEPERSIDLLQPFLAELDDPGDPWQLWRWAPHIYDGMARAVLAQGDHDASLVWTERELEVSRVHNSRKLEARALELRGRALMSMDLRDEARTELHASLEVSEDIGYPPTIWRADSLLLELARRNQDEAEATLRERRIRERLATAGSMVSEPRLERRLRDLCEALITRPLDAYR